MILETKKCSKCLKVLNVDQFYIILDRGLYFRLHPRCKKCKISSEVENRRARRKLAKDIENEWSYLLCHRCKTPVGGFTRLVNSHRTCFECKKILAKRRLKKANKS